MRFQVLGSLRVEADDRVFELRPGMPQRVLAMPLLRLGNPVTVDQLIDTLWPDAAPANAVKVVQTYVRRLRKAAIATEMHDTPARLDPFRTVDVATDIRAVFSWSERYLSGAAARLFRLLGLHPGPDISLAAAASLASGTVAMTQQILTELTEANLVISQTPGRYHLHDLVRAYAAERAGAAESEKALRRLFDHYVEHAHAADMLLNPNPLMFPLPSAATVFRDATQALDWLTAEHHCLLTALAYAADGGWDSHDWQLGLSLAGHLFRRGYWLDHRSTAKAAAASAMRCADTQSKVQCKINVARAELQLCGFDAAETHLRDALLLAGNTTDSSGKAEALHVLSWVLDLQGHRLAALAHAEQALKLFQANENRIGEARAMNTIGWLQSGLGNHTLAIAVCGRALRLHQEAAFREGESATWHSIGFAHQHLGNYADALTCYGHALRTCREIGYRLVEGLTLACLGDTHTALGSHGTAEKAWRQALIILEELNHPDAATVRAHLPAAQQSP